MNINNIINTQTNFINQEIRDDVVYNNQIVTITGDAITMTDNVFNPETNLTITQKLTNHNLSFAQEVNNGSINNTTADYRFNGLDLTTWYPDTGDTPVVSNSITLSQTIIQAMNYNTDGVVISYSRMMGLANDATTDSYSHYDADSARFWDDSGLRCMVGKTGLWGSYTLPIDINPHAGLTLCGTVSTEGQVMMADASGNPYWATVGGGGWVGTATSSLDMATFDITNTGDIACTNITPTTITDDTTLVGTAGQILTSTGTGIQWADGGGGWVGTAASDLDMLNYKINFESAIGNDVTTTSLSNDMTSILISTNVNDDGAGTVTTKTINLRNEGVTIDNVEVSTKGHSHQTLYHDLNMSMSTGTINDLLIHPEAITITDPNTLSYGALSTSSSLFIDTTASTSTSISSALMTGTIGSNVSCEVRSNGIQFFDTTTLQSTISAAGITSEPSVPYYINMNGGLLLQDIASTEGQVITADASGNPIWANGGGGEWVGTATSDLDMGNYQIQGINSADGDRAFSVDGYAIQFYDFTNHNDISVTASSFDINRYDPDTLQLASFSRFQANDTACVNYSDPLNATQCVISSFGIINSKVVDGEFFPDTSHYSKDDMHLSDGTETLDVTGALLIYANGVDSEHDISASGLLVTDTVHASSIEIRGLPENAENGLQTSLSPYTLNFSDEVGIRTRYRKDGIQTYNGNTFDISTAAGLSLQSAVGTDGQVIVSDPSGNPTWGTATSSWVSTANTPLDMATFEINNSGDISCTAISPVLIYDGTTVAGTAGQILSSTGTGIHWIDNTSGSWVGTATSDLDMNAYNITSSSALSIGNAGVATNLIGNVDVGASMTLGNGAYRFFGGIGSLNSTTSIDLGAHSYVFNLIFISSVTGTTAGQTMTLAPAVAGYYVTVINQSTQNWTIAAHTGDVIAGGLCNAGATSFILAPNKTVYLTQTTGAYVWLNESVSNSALIVKNIQNTNTNSKYYMGSVTNSQTILSANVTTSALTGTVTFSNAFTAVPVITCTVRDTTTANGHNMHVTTSSTSGFTWSADNAPTTGFGWMAIGVLASA